LAPMLLSAFIIDSISTISLTRFMSRAPSLRNFDTTSAPLKIRSTCLKQSSNLI